MISPVVLEKLATFGTPTICNIIERLAGLKPPQRIKTNFHEGRPHLPAEKV